MNEPVYDPSQTKKIPPEAKVVFKGKFHTLWQWDQKLYDGSTAIFERISRKDYAQVIGVDQDGMIILAHDEQPDRGSVLTPAGGGVDEGETPQEAGAREFLEETGYTAKEFVHWHTYRPSSKTDMFVYAFIGKGAVKIKEPELEPGEKVEVVKYSFEEFLELGKCDRLRDWLLRVKLLKACLDPAEKDNLYQLLYGE